MTNALKIALASSVAVASLIDAPPQARAQSTPDQGAQLEEVVVTARRREEVLQATPVSVSAVSAAKLDRLDIHGLDDVAQFVPNVTSVPSVAFIGGNSTAIRGIGEHEVLITGDSPVGQYLDGVYIAGLTTTNFDLVDPERIEVLRGPQGTLFGRNTTGGAINVVTKTPSDTFGILEKVSYATYDEIDTRTSVNTGDIGETGLKAVIAYQHRQRDGYVNNVNAPPDHDPGALRSDSLWFKLHGAWGALTLDYSFDFDRIRGETQAQQISYVSTLFADYYSNSVGLGGKPLVVDPNRLQNISLPRITEGNVGVLGHALTLQYALNDDVSLKSITGYRNFFSRGGSSSAPTGMLGNVYDPATNTQSTQEVQPYLGYNVQRLHQVSEELQILGSTDRIKYVGGLYYFNSRAVENEFANLTFITILPFLGPNPVGLNITSSTIADQTSESAAAFGQASYTPPILDDKLELTGGLRYTRDSKSMDQTAPTVDLQTRHFYNFSFNVTANYQWTPYFMTYGRISSGYRSGGYNVRAQAGQSYDFSPEKAIVYEAGVKSEWFEHRLRANAAAFYTDYQDLQVSQFTGLTAGSAGGVKNANATYTGFEFELLAKPIQSITIDGSIGYVHPEYQQIFFPDPVTGLLRNYASIAKFPYVPEWTNHIGIQYEMPIENVGNLILRTDYSYESEKYFFTTDLPTQNPFNDAVKSDGHNLLSARLTLTDVQIWNGRANLEASVWGDNLLDEDYLIQGVDYGPALGFASKTYGIPRRFGFDVKVTY